MEQVHETNIKEEVLSEEEELPYNDRENVHQPKCEDVLKYDADDDSTQIFVKSEPVEVSENLKLKEDTENRNLKCEGQASPDNVNARLLDAKRLLIQRKNDIQKLTGKKPGALLYSCSSCPYENSKKRNVEKHALIHKKYKEYKCDRCSYECHWKSWMIRHKQRHEAPSRDYKCGQCEYSARFKICLERHLMNHAKLKPFACHLCNYKGNSKGYLRSHMTIHSKIKPFACPDCEYSCTRKKYLLLHLKSHSLSKIRPKVPFAAKSVSGGFQCNLCEYRCMRKSTLQTHLKRHFSNEEFPCDNCSYKTNRKDLLQSHKLTHSTFKKFQCSLCEFKSHWSHCLRRHMFVKHLNFRPFKCAECDYTSADKSNLKKHVKSHLEALYCQSCEMEFKTKSNFTRHKNKVHSPQNLESENQIETDDGEYGKEVEYEEKFK